MGRDWRWVAVDVAISAHAEQLAEHGAAYGSPDVADLAAAYAFGIARNHPVVDGNKRTAAVVSETFLLLNGCSLLASDAEMVVAFLALAAGELSEEEMADWFRRRLSPAA